MIGITTAAEALPTAQGSDQYSVVVLLRSAEKIDCKSVLKKTSDPLKGAIGILPVEGRRDDPQRHLVVVAVDWLVVCISIDILLFVPSQQITLLLHATV